MQRLWEEGGDSHELWICPLDPSPDDYNFWSPVANRPNFPNEEGASYMFNEYSIWYSARDLNQSLRFSRVDINLSEWVMASDGVVMPSAGAYWRRNNPLFGGWGGSGFVHENSRVNFLFGDGHVEAVNAFTSDSYYVKPY